MKIFCRQDGRLVREQNVLIDLSRHNKQFVQFYNNSEFLQLRSSHYEFKVDKIYCRHNADEYPVYVRISIDDYYIDEYLFDRAQTIKIDQLEITTQPFKVTVFDSEYDETAAQVILIGKMFSPLEKETKYAERK